ncbi:MAG: nitroreductase family deazaflavin-dependent oxidoreductase [Anaerolineae bacterium]|nr:nitroreductase family deazaflavin-dependent oxidoreductase [Anaerolineae bacterium]
MAQEKTSSIGSNFMTYPAGGWRKALFKSPLLLWRLGLGSIIGRSIMVLTVTGRKSGLPRHTMAEWHPIGSRKFVPVAFGERAQWYKNIQANPLITIQTNEGAESVFARRITEEHEFLEAVRVVQQRNPVMAQWYFESRGITDANPENLLSHKDQIFFLTFDATSESTPPPLQADLRWVWLIVLGLFILLGVLLRQEEK